MTAMMTKGRQSLHTKEGGEAVSVEKVPSRKGMFCGIHFTVKTATETISVHLEPALYIENQETAVESKDA